MSFLPQGRPPPQFEADSARAKDAALEAKAELRAQLDPDDEARGPFGRLMKRVRAALGRRS